jgi:hypothetical protein
LVDKEYGKASSFGIGLACSLFGSLILALILWLILRKKMSSGYFWLGAFAMLIVTVGILLIMLPIILATGTGQIETLISPLKSLLNIFG